MRRGHAARLQSWSRNVGLLIALVAVLNVIGLVMVLSASSVHALRAYGSAWLFFQRQLMWVGTRHVRPAGHDARRLPRLAAAGRAAARPDLVLLVLVLVPGLGISVGGSARWLGVGFLRIQPSELAKLAVRRVRGRRAHAPRRPA